MAVIKIISNFYLLRDLCSEFLEYPKRDLSAIELLKIYLKSRTFDFIVLNFKAFDLLVLLFYKCVIPNQCKIVSMDLIIPPPKSFKARVVNRIKLFLLKRLHCAIVYFKDTSGYEREIGIDPGLFKFIPFKVNDIPRVREAKIRDDGYIFVGGKTRRDFDTLFEAVAGLPYPVKVVSPVNDELVRHGSYLKEHDLPPNVELV